MNKSAWLEEARKAGFESFEIYQSVKTERSFSWYEGKMDSFVTSSVTGTALRGVFSGKMVSWATENDDDSEMQAVLQSMKEMAPAITSEDEAIILKPIDTQSAADTKIWVKPEAEEIALLLKTIEEKILKYDERIVQVTYLQWQEETSGVEITNTYGMQAQDAGRVQMLIAGAAAVQDADVKDDYAIEVVPDIAALDTDAVVKKLCDGILKKLGAGSLPSGTYRVIFEKDAMTSLFGAFTDMFSGDRIGKGISPLRDKIGEQIFSPCITVIDDPRNPEAVSLRNYDDEGHPTERKTVVKNGIFQTPLHCTKSAARMHTQSTGNGFKSSFAGAVSVHPMNCCIMPGEKSLEELCKHMGEGVVITDLAGLHAGLDHVTGDFSLQCAGYLVKDGVRDRSVTLITVAANFLDLMKQVTAVGNDLDWKYHRTVCPSIAFEGCAISGE